MSAVKEDENQPNSSKKNNIKWRKKQKEVKWLKHYSSDHRILLVGEGDFSFSNSLGLAFGDASNIVATSLDSHDDVIKKYKGAKTNLENLHSLGAQLLHEVDALQMNLHRDLQKKKFDRIIFNFPHAGFLGREDDQQVIMMHRNLVSGFFKNASGMLHPKGEVHVTHKTSDPFPSWNIEELATQNSLTLLELVKFKLEDYPGYSNKRGDGNRSDEPFPLGECSTCKFVLFSKGDSSKEDGLCYCDPPLRKVEHVSWSKKNPNRRFMGCPKYGGPESAHCKSIDWIDPPLSGWYKAAMSELRKIRHERDEKEKLMKSLTHQRKEKEAEIEALVEEKIQNEKLMETLKSQNKELAKCGPSAGRNKVSQKKQQPQKKLYQPQKKLYSPQEYFQKVTQGPFGSYFAGLQPSGALGSAPHYFPAQAFPSGPQQPAPVNLIGQPSQYPTATYGSDQQLPLASLSQGQQSQPTTMPDWSAYGHAQSNSWPSYTASTTLLYGEQGATSTDLASAFSSMSLQPPQADPIYYMDIGAPGWSTYDCVSPSGSLLINPTVKHATDAAAAGYNLSLSESGLQPHPPDYTRIGQMHLVQ